jgi:hypothetical protein
VVSALANRFLSSSLTTTSQSPKPQPQPSKQSHRARDASVNDLLLSPQAARRDDSKLDSLAAEGQPEDEVTADVSLPLGVGVEAFGGVGAEGEVLFGRGGVGLGELVSGLVADGGGFDDGNYCMAERRMTAFSLAEEWRRREGARSLGMDERRRRAMANSSNSSRVRSSVGRWS